MFLQKTDSLFVRIYVILPSFPLAGQGWWGLFYFRGPATQPTLPVWVACLVKMDYGIWLVV